MLKSLAQADNESDDQNGLIAGAESMLETFLSNNSGLDSCFDGIVNNASTTKYPRNGKQDRDGQVLSDGSVITMRRRVIDTQKTQNNAIEHQQLVIKAEKHEGITQ